MFYEQKYRIQISDTRRTTNATNKGFLGLLEDIASLHSSEVGYGIYDMKKTVCDCGCFFVQIFRFTSYFELLEYSYGLQTKQRKEYNGKTNTKKNTQKNAD